MTPEEIAKVRNMLQVIGEYIEDDTRDLELRQDAREAFAEIMGVMPPVAHREQEAIGQEEAFEMSESELRLILGLLGEKESHQRLGLRISENLGDSSAVDFKERLERLVWLNAKQRRRTEASRYYYAPLSIPVPKELRMIVAGVRLEEFNRRIVRRAMRELVNHPNDQRLATKARRVAIELIARLQKQEVLPTEIQPGDFLISQENKTLSIQPIGTLARWLYAGMDPYEFDAAMRNAGPS